MDGESLENRSKRLLAASHANLAGLLVLDMNLAFTFLESAAITTIRERRDELIRKATRALESVRHLLTRITDQDTAAKIQRRAEELDAAILEALLRE